MRNGLLGAWMGFLLTGSAVLGQESGIADKSTPASPEKSALAVMPTVADEPTQPVVGGSPVSECNSCCWNCCGCDRSPRIYGSVDYLLWWIKNSRIPTFVEAQVEAAGAAGGLTSRGERVNNEERSGGRFLFGYWLGEERTLGIEGGYLFLGSRSVSVNGATANSRGVEDSILVNYASSSVPIVLTSRFQGAEANLVANLVQNQSFQLNALIGFRWLQLCEGANVNPNQSVQLTGDENGTVVIYQSSIQTSNNFYGGQIGARAEYQFGPLVANLAVRVGLGDTNQVLEITDNNIVNNVSFGQQGGGRTPHDRFAVVPEVDVNIGYDITPRVRVHMGYTFLYISDVIRPGDVTVVNGLANGQAVYSSSSRTSDFWTQGLNVGMAFRY